MIFLTIQVPVQLCQHPKGMFEAMELIDISCPEAARKSISTVMAHLRALDQFLVQISSEQTPKTPTEEIQLPEKILPCCVDLEVQCSGTAPGDTVVVVGSCPELGNWKADRGLPLRTSQELYPKWIGAVNIESCAARDVQFKLAILRPCGPDWEHIENRSLSVPNEEDGGHWQECLAFNMNKAVIEMPPKKQEKNDRGPRGPLPNLLLRGHGVGTEGAEVKVEKLATSISQPLLDKAFTDKVLGYSRGLIRACDVHHKITVGEMPENPAFCISCEKGSKGMPGYCDPPNQDNWSATRFKSGWTLFCVHDGHGPYGHHVSTRTVQTVPWFLIQDSGFDKDLIDEDRIEQALLHAFEKSQADLVRYAAENKIGIADSGSTALAVLLKGNKVWTANLGDSRSVVGSAEAELIFATEDPKPQHHVEKARIEAAGGEVRLEQVTHRIFIRGTDDPGLAVARAFGDLGLKDHGVIAVPEVKVTEVDLNKNPFVLIASDGIWEFIDSDEVVAGLGFKLRKMGAEAALQELHSHAKCKWTETCGNYRDDMTSILVQLR